MFDSKGFHECCKIWGFQRFIKIPPSYFPFLCKAIVKIVIKLFGTRQNRIFGNVTTWIVVIIVTNTLHYIQDGAPHPIRRRWLNDENSRWNQIIDLELINYKLPNSLTSTGSREASATPTDSQPGAIKAQTLEQRNHCCE